MRHVEALSRNPIILLIRDPILERLRQAHQSDEKDKLIAQLLRIDPYEDYRIEAEIL